MVNTSKNIYNIKKIILSIIILFLLIPFSISTFNCYEKPDIATLKARYAKKNAKKATKTVKKVLSKIKKKIKKGSEKVNKAISKGLEEYYIDPTTVSSAEMGFLSGEIYITGTITEPTDITNLEIYQSTTNTVYVYSNWTTDDGLVINGSLNEESVNNINTKSGLIITEVTLSNYLDIKGTFEGRLQFNNLKYKTTINTNMNGLDMGTKYISGTVTLDNEEVEVDDSFLVSLSNSNNPTIAVDASTISAENNPDMFANLITQNLDFIQRDLQGKLMSAMPVGSDPDAYLDKGTSINYGTDGIVVGTSNYESNIVGTTVMIYSENTTVTMNITNYPSYFGNINGTGVRVNSVTTVINPDDPTNAAITMFLIFNGTITVDVVNQSDNSITPKTLTYTNLTFVTEQTYTEYTVKYKAGSITVDGFPITISRLY